MILSPPPDLVVSSIVVPATAQSDESISIMYKVENQGLSAPYTTWWYDRLVSKLSSLKVYMK